MWAFGRMFLYCEFASFWLLSEITNVSKASKMSMRNGRFGTYKWGYVGVYVVV